MKKARRYLAWALVLALLLCGCGTETPYVTTQETTQGTAPETTGMVVPEHNWTLTEDWSVSQNESGAEVLSAPGQENAMAFHGVTLSDGWGVHVEVMPDGDDVRILLCKENGDVQLAVAVNVDGRKAQLRLDEWKSETWKNISTNEKWVEFDDEQPLQLSVCRYAGMENIRVTLRQNSQELASFKATGVTLRTLSALSMAGIGADANAVFSGFTVEEAQKPDNPMDTLLKTIQPGDEGFYCAIAVQAVADMLGNFWTGDTVTGQIRPTWSGFSDTLYDWRGSIWETAMLVFEIYDMWAITGDTYYYDLLTAQAKFFRENFTEYELENAGGNFHWASDDCAWNALMYLCYYSVTGDAWFVERAIGLLDNVNERWYDEDLNGIYYKDNVDFMSLYEVGIAWSWLQIWEITGEQRFYDLALRSYEGMHDRLGADRGDGLYYCEANINWPRGGREEIHEAGSSSFLTGNMGMAALSAKFYRLTGEQEYLDRVYKTNEGLLQYYNNDGVLLNDRDAWTNGTFAAFYASEVLTLPNTEEMQMLLKNTAVSIVTNARTEEGYYGGSWSGPAEGSGSVWYSGGSVPEQSMTTGTSILMVTAAAILEAGIKGYVR